MSSANSCRRIGKDDEAMHDEAIRSVLSCRLSLYRPPGGLCTKYVGVTGVTVQYSVTRGGKVHLHVRKYLPQAVLLARRLTEGGTFSNCILISSCLPMAGRWSSSEAYSKVLPQERVQVLSPELVRLRRCLLGLFLVVKRRCAGVTPQGMPLMPSCMKGSLRGQANTGSITWVFCEAMTDRVVAGV